MKVLVTGIAGQLGFDVCKELNKRNYEVIGIDKAELDLTCTDVIQPFVKICQPQAIIHCAAYTAVDKAESEIDLCMSINAEATKALAQEAALLDIPFIYISTDYIFDGSKEGLYIETDSPNPINVYGQSKWLGECYVKQFLTKYYIVRISWVFGENGNNFIKTMLRLGETKEHLNIIDDQVGTPTYTKDLARLLVDMLESNKYGTYHATNEGYCSWYEFAKKIFAEAKININLSAIKTEQYPTPARRPLNSKLSKEKLVNNGFKPLRLWEEALVDYLKHR